MGIFHSFRRLVATRFRRATCCAVALLGAVSAARAAEKSPPLDLEAWRRIPVYHDGRLMPLDTFARNAVEVITGRVNPRLSLAENVTADEFASEALAPARSLFPDDAPRKFSAAELLLSWLVEPEKWEEVPFITARHPELREKYLEVPVTSADGENLQFVSPRQVRDAGAFQQKLQDLREEQMQAEAEGQSSRPVGVSAKAQQLFQAYALYRQLIFDPTLDPAARQQFDRALSRVAPLWSRLSNHLGMLRELGDKDAIGATVLRLEAASDQLNELLKERNYSVEMAETAADAFATAAAELADKFADVLGNMKATSPPGMQPDQAKKLITAMEQFESDTRALSTEATALVAALYENRKPLRVVPGLNAASLEKGRKSGEEAHPWLDLQTLLEGSPRALRAYPEAELTRARTTFGQLAQAYRERAARPRELTAAQADFAIALLQLGERIEPLRDKLAMRERDEDLLRHTAYPPPGHTEAEVRYNSLDPFRWSWIISALSAVCFAGVFVFGEKRSRLFWIGMAVLFAGLLWAAYGFYLRIVITGWAPVTNMYETVIYVPFFVTLLGAWFAMLPLTWSGVQRAWRLSAVPGTWEAKDDDGQVDVESGGVANLLLLVPRTALSVYLFLALAWWPWYSGGRTILNLKPTIDVGSRLPDLNDAMTWGVGLCVLAAAVWYLPRLAVALGAALATVPLGLLGGGATPLLLKTYARWPFALVASVFGFVGYAVAWFAPVLDKDFQPLQPVLRDQFWLLVHVPVIVSSYGAGMLAWGLGVIALGYYLFGKYRRPVSHAGGATVALPARAPEACYVLGGYAYKAIQVAVLLLAAGTILGALWADVAWGRFWGWDPKEVWALISLLVYIAILHGRYAGLVDNFGLIAGTVLGASAIIMSWYGVNFVLGKGLHSYGFGEDQSANYYIAGVMLANWFFLGLAGARYWIETSGPKNLSGEALVAAEEIAAHDEEMAHVG